MSVEPLIYAVRVEVDDAAVLRDFVGWLRDRHVADVCAAGAETGEIVVLDGAHAVECRYVFASRAAFAAYERDHAPRLRAEGLAALGGRAARFTRSTGARVAFVAAKAGS